jgi:hypothetical protein
VGGALLWPDRRQAALLHHLHWHAGPGWVDQEEEQEDEEEEEGKIKKGRLPLQTLIRSLTKTL